MVGLTFIDCFYVVFPFGDHKNPAHRREAREALKSGLNSEQSQELKRIRFDKQFRGYQTIPKISNQKLKEAA